MEFKLEPYHRNVDDNELLGDLKNVAKKLNKNGVTIDEYAENGIYHPSTLQRRFGSWFSTLEKAGLERTRTLGVTNDQYFENIEQMWRKLGRQPRYTDMVKPISAYCAGAYEHRFGSWRKALESFIVFISDTENCEDQSLDKKYVPNKEAPRSKRDPSWRLRFIVMRRDNFKCKICGRTPATDPNVELHIDHITPWSRGGITVLDNLQTLCSVCNIGKSDLPIS